MLFWGLQMVKFSWKMTRSTKFDFSNSKVEFIIYNSQIWAKSIIKFYFSNSKNQKSNKFELIPPSLFKCKSNMWNSRPYQWNFFTLTSLAILMTNWRLTCRVRATSITAPSRPGRITPTITYLSRNISSSRI